MVPRWVLGVVAAAVAVAAVDIAVLVVTRDARSVTTTAPGAQPAAAADVVAVINPATSRVVDRVSVGRTPTIVTAGYGGAWVLNKDDGTLSHLDAHSHHVIGTMRLDVVATDLALGAGGVWFAGRPGTPIDIGALPRGIAAGDGAVWVTLN